MTPKQLRALEAEFHRACVLACLYGCGLSVDQFCSSVGLELEERNEVVEYFEKVSIEV